MRGSWRVIATVAALATACNALLGIDEAGPIRGQAGDASVSGSAGVSGGSGASGSGGSGGTGATAGSGGASSCDASVVDDPENCGACERSCLGSDCYQGQCVPTMVKEFPFRLYSLTLTADQIFASAYVESGVVRVSKTDFSDSESWAATQFGYDGYSPLFVYGQDVYFSHYEGNAIYKGSAAALGTPQKIVTTSNGPGNVVIHASIIYWDTCGAGLWKAPLTGGPESQVAAIPDCPNRVVLDGDTLWATSASAASLFRVSLTTGAAVEFSVGPSDLDTYALAVGQTHVYFATYQELSGSGEYPSLLHRIDKNAPAGTSAESLQGGTVFDTLSDMTIADGFLYFVTSGSAAGAYVDGRVMRVPLSDPNAAPEIIAENRKYPVAVAVDDQFIYWIDELDPGWSPAQIWRVAK